MELGGGGHNETHRDRERVEWEDNETHGDR